MERIVRIEAVSMSVCVLVESYRSCQALLGVRSFVEVFGPLFLETYLSSGERRISTISAKGSAKVYLSALALRNVRCRDVFPGVFVLSGVSSSCRGKLQEQLRCKLYDHINNRQDTRWANSSTTFCFTSADDHRNGLASLDSCQAGRLARSSE